MTRTPWTALVCIPLLASCEKPDEKPAPVAPIAEKAQDFYQNKVLPPVEDASKWVKDEVAKRGDWEYHVATLPDESDEKLASTLNALGTERWEVIWIERPANDFGDNPYRVFLKRPAGSLLR